MISWSSDKPAASDSVRDRQRHHGGNSVEGHKETEERAARVAEVVLPGIEVLDGVEKRSANIVSISMPTMTSEILPIVTVGGRSNTQHKGVEV